jgi:hypothetical protein
MTVALRQPAFTLRAKAKLTQLQVMQLLKVVPKTVAL